ncbi:MAG: glycerate kinase [candidate division WOR-3 bacterium]|nr:MAG: glycerate kinase [candidate division WOR-3 bacterium]
MKTEPQKREKPDIVEFFLAGLRAVDAYEITRCAINLSNGIITITGHHGKKERYDLSKFKRILTVGFGKAALPMACAVEQLLLDRITKGMIVCPYGTSGKTKRIEVIEAGHPIPDASSIQGARRIIEMTSDLAEDDFLILLVSGGGSALFTMPAPGIAIEDLRQMNEILLECGANIDEINTVRKHLSQIKGGQLARLAHPATTAALLISDVVGDMTHTIASGPAAPDPSTFGDALNILRKHEMMKHTPQSIIDRLEAGRRGEITETPKSGDPIFKNTSNIIIGSNMIALQAIAHHAAEKGYRPLILSSRITGDTRLAAMIFASMIKEIKKRHAAVSTCIVSGGEMTTAVKGSGSGGRNQDFCLSLSPLIKGMKGVQVLSAGTDGIDGKTEAAGAVIDGNTHERARAMGLDIGRALADYDSHSFFRATGDLIITGRTNTNVMDIQIILLSQTDQMK